MKLSLFDSFVHKIRGVMGKSIRVVLEAWPKNFIKTADLVLILGKSANACYGIIKRALRAGLIIRMRRGLYLIARVPLFVEAFELALPIYGPSFVSLESSLSYHGWIPEAVYTTTCVSAKRAKEFQTPVGTFSYKRVPEEQFYVGVERIETKSGAIFIALPWRALADFMYVRRKSWGSIEDLEKDLRIDMETIIGSNKKILSLLMEKYPSRRVRENLKRFFKEIAKKTRESS